MFNDEIFSDVKVKVIEEKIKYRKIEGVKCNLAKGKLIKASKETFLIILNYYNIFK